MEPEDSKSTAVTGTDDQQYRWSQKSLSELSDFYWEQIAPLRNEQGYDPQTDRPTYDWLAEYGFSGIAYALREHHDLTLKEFFVEVVEIGDRGGEISNDYEWGIDDEQTLDELQNYYQTLLERREDLAESTARTHRSRLATFARAYKDVHGAAEIVQGVAEIQRQAEEIERCLAVFDRLNDDLKDSNTKLRYLEAVDQFYGHLLRRGKGAFNPVRDFADEYGWQRSTPDERVSLNDQQVRALYAATEDDTERLLVLATCAWGLRTEEVARLHWSQFATDADPPHIAFDQRKNAPSTVSLLFGVDLLEEYTIELGTVGEWNGYLFPSTAAAPGHITDDTVRNRFRDLAERAEITVDCDLPTPKHGRRWWYNKFTRAIDEFAETLEGIAVEQGSTDVDVVRQHYLESENRSGRYQRVMREALSEVFD
jgi:integrase